VADLRSGEDHDPEEEMRSLLPLARLVSEGLKGGGEGARERASEARLMAAIARSEEKRSRQNRRRSWSYTCFAATGWATTSLCLSLIAYQYGVNQTLQSRAVALAPPTQAVPALSAPAEKETREPKPSRKRHYRPSSASRTARKSDAAPPSVRVDEINTTQDLLADVPPPDLSQTGDAPNNVQNDLMKEGSSQLAQGQWDKAADSFEQAANQNPNDESALDALHLSGAIAERALNDPKRASEMYRREMIMARQMLAKREAEKDAPSEPVKQRLARAMTYVGLLEKNPHLILQAAQENSDAGAGSNAEASPSNPQ
jgi:hypothetical protein